MNLRRIIIIRWKDLENFYIGVLYFKFHVTVYGLYWLFIKLTNFHAAEQLGIIFVSLLDNLIIIGDQN